jgi:phosphoribosylglycinamide formyltransferase 2
VVKPLMSSSGRRQSVLKNLDDQQQVWDYAINNSRGDIKEVIIEEFIAFDTGITLLTVTQKNGPTCYFVHPLATGRGRGDYQESWQPVFISDADHEEARKMAEKVTTALTGTGIWGVEFFMTAKGVYFSELSPRPHDTGMVTLAGTQNLSQFELHARASWATHTSNTVGKSWCKCRNFSQQNGGHFFHQRIGKRVGTNQYGYTHFW